MKKRRIITFIILDIVLFVIFMILINLYIIKSTEGQIKDIDKLNKSEVALLLGAKVYTQNVSDIVKDRIDTAYLLYKNKIVKKILVSGDHGNKDYDEVNVIKNFLLEKNVPKEDIFLDHAGFSTYESIYRAREIFDIKSVIIVTQEFHLPRSIFLANSKNIETQGIIADKRIYKKEFYNNFREFFARIKDFIFAKILKPAPKFLGDKIPISGDAQKSWDMPY